MNGVNQVLSTIIFFKFALNSQKLFNNCQSCAVEEMTWAGCDEVGRCVCLCYSGLHRWGSDKVGCSTNKHKVHDKYAAALKVEICRSPSASTNPFMSV